MNCSQLLDTVEIPGNFATILPGNHEAVLATPAVVAAWGAGMMVCEVVNFIDGW